MPPRPARPIEVVALTVLLFGAAAMLLIGVLFPFSPGTPIALGWALLAVALVLAVGTLTVGDRLPRGALVAEAGVAVALNSVLVAEATTQAGAVIDAIAYVWLVGYVALFFPRAALGFALFTVAAFGAGLLASGLPAMLTAWALIALTIVGIALLLARLSSVTRRLLHRDPLTGALNRAGLDLAAQALFARTRRRRESLTVAMLDLDGFKQVNDTRGHAYGDRLLAETAAAWRGALRGDDVLARVGGDEFVLLLPATTPDQAGAVLDRLDEATAAAWSTGVVLWQEDEPLDACLDRADERLYAAKDRRRLTRAA